jgi:tetratricopeptide (TPR) repeat protein/DNA polymerase III delta prime subunit
VGRPERKLPGENTPLTEFASALRALRLAAGSPSYRELSATTHYSVASLARAADGRTLPSLDVTLAYACACGADSAEWQRRWEAVAVALRSSGLPGSPGPPEATSLPSSVPDFTGRAGLLDQLKTLLSGPGAASMPPVAVIGPAGVGKTTLAVRAAHELVTEFPTGRIYLRARDTLGEPVAASLLMFRMLVTLGVRGADIPDDGEARRMLYHRLLRGHRFLLVIDDIIDAEPVRALLPSDPHCAALLTSRTPLEELEAVQHLRLGTFSAAEANQLLQRIVGRDRVAAEPAAAREIVQACGMLPLAVRIAGARLRSRPHWTLREMAGRLTDERRRLDELAVADTGVRTSLALSDRRLGSRAWRAFRLLGTLDVVELTPWIAAAALGIPEQDAADQCDALATAGLLEPAAGTARFRFHDLVRLYARELSAAHDTEADRAAALERTLLACARLVEAASPLLPGGVRGFPGSSTAAGPGSPGAMGSDGPGTERPAGLTCDPEAWLASEEANLLAVFQQGCRSGAELLAVRLGLGLVAFLELESRYDSWRIVAGTLRDTASRGVAAPAGGAAGGTARVSPGGAADQNALVSAYGMYMQGVLASELGRPVEAVELIGAAAVLFDRLGEQRARAYADVYLGNNHHGLGDLCRAVAEGGRAQRTFQALGDRQGLGYAHLVVGTALVAASGQPGEAARELSLASQSFRAVRHAQGEAHATRALAHLQAQQGQFRAAGASYRRALRALGPGIGAADEAMLTLGLARVLHEQGQPGQALRLAKRAAGIFQRLDNCFLQTRADHLIACIELTSGESESAIARLERAAAAYGELDARLWQARALRDLGEAWMAAGNRARAQTVWARAQAMLTDDQLPDAAELATLRAGLEAAGNE